MSPRATLEAARALIADESHWCRHTLARNSAGLSTSCLKEDAVRFCAEGALFRTIGTAWTSETYFGCFRPLCDAARGLHPETFGMMNPLAWVNDTIGYTAAIAVYDKAIAALETT